MGTKAAAAQVCFLAYSRCSCQSSRHARASSPASWSEPKPQVPPMLKWLLQTVISSLAQQCYLVTEACTQVYTRGLQGVAHRGSVRVRRSG